jgi:hypothetical protein
MSIAPDAEGDPLLCSLCRRSQEPHAALEWVGYLSTVGVYGDHAGDWVDEETACKPVSRRSIARVAAEQGWQDMAAAADVPLAILRLSGIYGPGRNALKTLMRARRAGWSSRARCSTASMSPILAARPHCWRATTLAGSSTSRMIFLHRHRTWSPMPLNLMGVEPPPESDFETADLTPMARSFYGENKRVANARIKAAGYSFAYPDYMDGLGALWRDGPGEADPPQCNIRRQKVMPPSIVVPCCWTNRGSVSSRTKT